MKNLIFITIAFLLISCSDKLEIKDQESESITNLEIETRSVDCPDEDDVTFDVQFSASPNLVNDPCSNVAVSFGIDTGFCQDGFIVQYSVSEYDTLGGDPITTFDLVQISTVSSPPGDNDISWGTTLGGSSSQNPTYYDNPANPAGNSIDQTNFKLGNNASFVIEVNNSVQYVEVCISLVCADGQGTCPPVVMCETENIICI